MGQFWTSDLRESWRGGPKPPYLGNAFSSKSCSKGVDSFMSESFSENIGHHIEVLLMVAAGLSQKTS